MKIEMRRVDSLTEHPDASAVPSLTPDQYAVLLASVTRHGVKHALDIDVDGRVIDGRNRLRAAREIGLEQVPTVVTDETDVAQAACDAAVARRNLTVSGRVLVLYVAHPALRRGAKERGHGNLIPGARQKKALGLSVDNPRESKEFGTFAALAESYRVPSDYFSKLGAIEAQCADADEWNEIQRKILEDEHAIPALNAGMGGKAATKGKKRSDPQYAVIAPRAAVTLGNSFKAWNRIPQDGRQRVLAEMRAALQVTPDAVRALIQASILEHWPDHEKAELSALLKRAGAKSGRHS
ncbi:MAG: ParB N-terminal domain-containing protein [Verrucomicrobia bacterium]|nr:ParB N-terminal domain-containing protein [Verrucomicrobiota bacterium]